MGDCLLTQITDDHALLGESPLWDRDLGRLWWVDIEGGDLHWLDATTSMRGRWPVGPPLSSVRLAERGHLVLGVRNAVYLAEPNQRTLTELAVLDADRSTHRLNESACDSSGRLWVGTMRLDATGRDSALYRVESEERGVRISRMVGSVGISNGLGWSPDQATMYYADTPTNRIDAFEFNLTRGTLGRRRTFVDLAPARPDGLAVDSNGSVWVALPSHGQVRRYSPAGGLEGVIEAPARRVTSCCFGGADLGDLFVTTARDRDPDAPVRGGAVYRCRPGVSGSNAFRFSSPA